MKIKVTLFLINAVITAAQQYDPRPRSLYMEVNYDFTDKDIQSVAADKAESCLDSCLRLYSKCKAFSWSNANGGTCWLKEAKGQVVYKEGVTSSALYFGTPPTCELQDGVDFVGNDLSHAPAKTAEECCDKCHQTAQCRAYTWTNFKNGTCWFKTQRGEAVAKAGVKAAFAYPDDAYPDHESFLPKYVDTDFVGHDIGNRRGKFEECADACKKFAGCHAYTWTSFHDGTCWLKAKKDKTVAKTGANSAEINKFFIHGHAEDDVDYTGKDMSSVSGITDAEDCEAICADTGRCFVVTWSNYHGGTCWLKTGPGEKRKMAGVKSYFM